MLLFIIDEICYACIFTKTLGQNFFQLSIILGTVKLIFLKFQVKWWTPRFRNLSTCVTC